MMKLNVIINLGDDNMSITVSKDEIKRYLKISILSEMTLTKEKIKTFEKKYGCTFEEFEETIKSSDKEVFEQWDEYIEWKAYIESLNELERKMRAIENAKDIKIS